MGGNRRRHVPRRLVSGVLIGAGVLSCSFALVLAAAETGAAAWVTDRVAAAAPTPAPDPDHRVVRDVAAAPDLAVGLQPTAAEDRPTAVQVATAIGQVPLDGLGGGLAGVVVDPATDATLYDRDAHAPVMPASTMKVLTAVTALEALGPDHVFTTRTVRTDADTVVLVGGGDPYLSSAAVAAAHPERAGIDALAAATAEALRAEDRTTIRLQWDASLFSAAAWQEDWPDTYADQVSPVSALVVDQARLAGTSPGPRSTTPAADAARVFAEALGRNGITVTDRSAVEAPVGDADLLAAVDSAPLAAIVEDLLVESDNDAAEIVAHQVGVAVAGEGSFPGAAAGVEQVLREHGLWDGAAVLRDGSGLSRQNRLTPAMLAGAVALAVQDPTLRPALTGLPVGAATGTLEPRFVAVGTEPGRGRIRAKTGTLRGTSGLAGYTVTEAGAVLAFAFVVNDASSDDAARIWLDRVATRVATA